jgi:hypothetical protein
MAEQFDGVSGRGVYAGAKSTFTLRDWPCASIDNAFRMCSRSVLRPIRMRSFSIGRHPNVANAAWFTVRPCRHELRVALVGFDALGASATSVR